MPLLVVENLVKEYTRSDGLFGRSVKVRAVDGVSFSVEAGETFGLVGESGSGKTTTARCILRLESPTSGSVTFAGRDLLKLSGGDLRRARRQMQVVFQDPDSSLNPRMAAGRIVEEPLLIHRRGTRPERRARVEELFRLVGLDLSLANRRPQEMSGGQRQRLGVARALALEPALVVADEPVSALDLSVQAQVVNLLVDLQERLGLTYLFIAHDLRVVRRICGRVAVMCRGRVVEMGSTATLFGSPAHPYTRALLSAIPQVRTTARTGSCGVSARARRLEWDAEGTDLALPLRQVEDGHWARV